MKLYPLSLNSFVSATRPLLASAAALVAAGALQAGTFTFEATTTGTWVGDDSGAPLLTIHIEHPSVVAPGFSFSSLVADEGVNTAGVPFLVAGTLVLTALDGDTVSAHYSGTVLPSGNPGEFLGSTLLEFTGGTGQFSGASGGGTLDAVVQFTGPLDGISTWELSGTLNTVPESIPRSPAAALLLFALGLGRRVRQTHVQTGTGAHPESRH